jgi:hypothetical protein
LRNDLKICVRIRFQIPQVLFAWQAIFYPQKRSVISVDSAKNFGMGLAVGACRITLQWCE